MGRGTIVVVIAWMALAPVAGRAQQTRSQSPAPAYAVPSEEAHAIAQGWLTLAAGTRQAAEAATRELVQKYPRNAAVLTLVVETDLKYKSIGDALASYDRWRAGRPVEEPLVLRRIARAVLHAALSRSQHDTAQTNAIKALVADGESVAVQPIIAALKVDDPSNARVLAAAGDPRGAEMLIQRFDAEPGRKVRQIETLAEAGVKSAIPRLIGALKDRDEENRAAAATALGQLGAVEAVPLIRPMLNEQRFLLRQAAATALFRLGDTSGLSLISEMANSPEPAVQVEAASILATRPDPAWENLVRRLIQASDPEVRVRAARLLGPVDPAAARSVLDVTAKDANPAIRVLSAQFLTEIAVGDFPRLRELLSNPDVNISVVAASRILEFTK